jgi:hypothetical protein
VQGSSEHSYEPSGSIKCWEVLEYLHNWQFLKRCSASWQLVCLFIESLKYLLSKMQGLKYNLHFLWKDLELVCINYSWNNTVVRVTDIKRELFTCLNRNLLLWIEYMVESKGFELLSTWASAMMADFPAHHVWSSAFPLWSLLLVVHLQVFSYDHLK